MSRITTSPRRLAAIAFTSVTLAGGIFSAGALDYTVRPSDTLFGLSMEYGVSQARLARVNNLDGTDLRIGQTLIIPEGEDISITVRPGDTLSGLSVIFDIPVADILSRNRLDSADLRIGQEILIPAPVAEGLHRVNPGDTLTGIAARYGLSVASLRAYNAMSDDTIHPGELLTVVPGHPETYRVGNGESLWTVAVEFGLTMEQIREWNGISGDVIHPGQVLALYPGIDTSTPVTPTSPVSDPEVDNVLLASVRSEKAPEPGKKSDIPTYGEYFYNYPDRDTQPNDTYWEESGASSMTDYNRALTVLALYDETLEDESTLSNALAGWHIVIDPGHGGLDPGAIVTVKDGSGNPLTVTEDEYAYDISMRMYRALSRHGASVSLTILSPDHHVRDGEDARQTFVHRKNEVYNDEVHNGNVGWRPVGTTDGLDKRKEIAGEQISEAASLAKRKGTIYISVHADNSPELPAGRAVLFDGADSSETADSRELATVMAANLGAGSFVKQQPLRVLRNNPADAAILVEVRNVHYDRNCWALRSASLREQDALMVVDGILDWASRN